MKLVVIGTNLPGSTFCDSDVAPLTNVHVGVQIRTTPECLVRGDADEARWELDIDVAAGSDGALDFRGPAVHGKRGDRFVYLTWGDVHGSDKFLRFRRAKLMLNRIDLRLIGEAMQRGLLTARVDLTDELGAPRCARVDPPAVVWSID